MGTKKKRELTAFERLETAKKLIADAQKLANEAEESLIFTDRNNMPFAKVVAKDCNGSPAVKLIEGHATFISVETLERLVAFARQHTKGVNQ